ncbi:SDR family NAD(P)-dependent oxidoreductase [Nocardia harenae]|uniref:SDR family NAD(P)-dependent oxidoreductase n=1 Tax=Nocardia harenae TaxID=358707 RepID=UPI00082F51B3|nr:SDR family NAD(P)-dependent oxidoreductase [Nocardia harenae]
MGNKTVLITGGSDGIGAAAARHAVAQGHQVVIVGRDPVKTRSVASELDIDHHIADYAELDQVRALGETLRATYPRIDVLANNAGGILGDRIVTADGYEKTFQVNHLGGFLLTNILLPTLIESSASVIQTASVGARVGKVNFDDLQNERRYTALTAYGTSKLENILFTAELDRRYRDQGISAAAFHPGNVASNFGNGTGSALITAIYKLARPTLISSEKGADTLNWLIDSTPRTDWETGKYYVKRKGAKTNSQAWDPAVARTLWERSAELVGLPS